MPRCHQTKTKLALAAAWSTALLTAAPPLTTIQDVLYRADGSRFNGVAQISWKGFQASNGSEIAKQSLSLRISNGALRVALVPTTTASSPTVYTVRFHADSGAQFTEFWAVPPAAAPLKLHDVRVQSPPPGNIVDPGGPVDIVDVIGLRTELDLRPGRGAGYAPSRAAVINASGAIDAAIGNPGDCLRVDGTTGPCGSGSLIFVDGEIPAGSINGLNTAFELSSAPVPATSLSLFRNGVLLSQAIDYTISGKTILLTQSNAPVPGDGLQAWYRLPPTGIPAIEFIDGEVPQGATNGVNAVFTLSGTPMPASSLRLYRNGVLQSSGVDYDLALNTITFKALSIPSDGDILQVFYRR